MIVEESPSFKSWKKKNGLYSLGLVKIQTVCVLIHHQSLSSSLSDSSFFFSSCFGGETGGGRSRRAHNMASDFFMVTSILAAIMFTILLLTSITCREWRVWQQWFIKGHSFQNKLLLQWKVWCSAYPPQADFLLKLLLPLKHYMDVKLKEKEEISIRLKRKALECCTEICDRLQDRSPWCC